TVEGENDPRIPRQLGLACAAIGRDLEARAWLRLAVRRDPLDTESQKALYQLEHAPSCRSTTKEPPGTGGPAGVREPRGEAQPGPVGRDGTTKNTEPREK